MKTTIGSLRAGLLAGVLLLAAGPLAAQSMPDRTRFGVQLSFADDADLGLGVRLRHSLRSLFPSAPLSGIATLDVFFPGGGVNYGELNYNVVYNFNVASAPRVTPYAGAGINLAYISVDTPGFGSASDTDLGLNLLGGILFRTASNRVTPFIELKAELGGGDQLVVAGGIYF